ncbi:hypothetical protein EV421DRAFT_1913613 [Armillaria borealis]|uniref:Uncharacterized protein n=1 Tax=Armillaria borealis TaxID=47425 RepID=A0AA39MDM5_9AGAR|nr:hypothetical protein EV421DRAFT_1913613 [Armillaria borealis]
MCHVIISSGYPRLCVNHHIAISISILVYFPNDYPPIAIALSMVDSGIFSFEEILSNIRMQPASSWTSLFMCSIFPFSNNGQLWCRPNLTDFLPLSEWRFTPSITEYPFYYGLSLLSRCRIYKKGLFIFNIAIPTIDNCEGDRHDKTGNGSMEDVRWEMPGLKSLVEVHLQDSLDHPEYQRRGPLLL